ncbi:hypothetical protein E2C01_070722 [Portunus trituberculatus]|uniref:Uncharacterized protein n=1 Tax=Portunus trituberculatus TaxID=210409 RepID=A0A5B7HY27_PORTR|nr:hypothetical protein [Portunus trituberculatus]
MRWGLLGVRRDTAAYTMENTYVAMILLRCTTLMQGEHSDLMWKTCSTPTRLYILPYEIIHQSGFGVCSAVLSAPPPPGSRFTLHSYLALVTFPCSLLLPLPQPHTSLRWANV